ncbi:head-tail connector protein [Paratissierella segnis]|uniref:DNA-packaging protein n=1 Tax=Paratissierella segnis TaxID=2763679 RepID=A0A926IKA5_9FIRM|nr:head-tail connector protein [Paratissierella segnis]MBC8588090.1 DNA-packaging protein [Paratissierella segnis]
MLNDIKDALRINGEDLNNEILDLIGSAKADLILSGVNKDKVIDTDPLIKRAVILYCKANFGYDDVKLSERFEQSYISLKHHLTLSTEYTVGDVI